LYGGVETFDEDILFVGRDGNVRAIARNWNTIGSGGSLKGTVGLEELEQDRQGDDQVESYRTKQEVNTIFGGGAS
jgi:hypothetical protein